MGSDTNIEWCDATFNPWIGCTKLSPACDNCYAARQDAFRHWTPEGWGGPRRRTVDWRGPTKWNAAHDAFHAQHGRRQRVFCASLADVFDNQAPGEWREDLFELIRTTPNLDWLLLTKRPQNIVRMVREHGAIAGNGTRYLPDNVWLGATVEDQQRADQNVPALLRCRDELGARTLFLSCEPLLGPVDLTAVPVGGGHGHHEFDPIITANVLKRAEAYPPLPQVNWVIAGGESGPKARPAHLSWAQALRDQCEAAGVPFLWKQWGEWIPAGQPLANGALHTRIREFGYDEQGRHRLHRIGKKAAGRLLDGVEHNGFPEAR